MDVEHYVEVVRSCDGECEVVRWCWVTAVPARPTNVDKNRARVYCAWVRVRNFWIICLPLIVSFLSPPLWETA